MTRVLHCGSLIGVLMLGLACGTERPTAPSAVPRHRLPPTDPSAAATTSFGRPRRDLRLQRPTRLLHSRFYGRLAIPLVRQRSIRAAI